VSVRGDESAIVVVRVSMKTQMMPAKRQRKAVQVKRQENPRDLHIVVTVIPKKIEME